MSVKNKSSKIILIVVVTSVSIFILIIAAILSSGSETRVSAEHEQNVINILDCTAISPAEPFFAYDSEIKSGHRVKVEYVNDSFSGFNFTYTGTYPSADDADKALSWLHADYNKYVASTGVYQEDLYPTFSAMGSDVVINLFLPRKYFNSGTAKFVFIGGSEFTGIDSKSIQEVRELYEDKGFSCSIINNKGPKEG